jgi:integrase
MRGVVPLRPGITHQGDLVGVPGAVSDHLEYLRLRGRSQGTIDARRRALARLAAALPCPLLEALPEDLLAWRARMRLGADAIRGYVSHAHQFYAWAAGAGLLEHNPAAGLPVPPKGRRLPRPISERDLMAALAAAPPRIRIWLVLAAWCGLRAKEIALLRRENILDHARPPVLVVAADATKGHSERIVPLALFAQDEIALARLPASGYAFRRLDGKPGPNGPWTVSKACNSHLHDCGIAATLHQLRHRFGTQAYHHERDLRAVQELLGHQSPATTAGYADYDNAAAAAAVAAIPVPRRLRAVRRTAGGTG